MRNIIGGLLALLGAAATLVSPWQAWYNGRHGSTYKFWEVFGSGITDSRSGVTDSVFLVFLITAVVCVAGVLLRSRTLVAVAGVIALGFTILWMVRQGNAAGELTISGTTDRGLGTGVADALGGSILMVVGAAMMSAKAKTKPSREAQAAQAPKGKTMAPAAPAGTAPAASVPTTAPPASATPPADRTGTERLSKEEQQMLGLTEDAEQKPQQP